MPQVIDVGGESVEFPDSMSDEDIVAAIRQMMQPQAPQQEESALSTMANEYSAPQAALISAGKVFSDIGAGVQDMYYGITGNEEAQSDLARQQGNEQELFDPLQEANPISTAIGGALPYLATAPLSGGLVAQMAIGGVLGGLEYGDQAQNAALGAGLSALPFGAGKLIRAGSEVPERLVARADELGYRLTPGERTGIKPLQMIESGFESFPLTSGRMASFKAPRQEVLNRVAAEAMGESGSLSDDALGLAAERIGASFDDVTQGALYSADDEFIGALAGIEDKARRGILGGDTTSKVIDNMLDQIGDGNITGEQAQEWSSMLGKAVRQAYKSDMSEPGYAQALSSIKDTVDNLVYRQSDDALKESLSTARSQWRALTTIEKSKSLDEAGNISGPKLANRLAIMDKSGYTRGRNKSDLYDAARISKVFRPPVGSSGTAERMSVQSIISGAISPISAVASLPTAQAYLTIGDLWAKNPQAAGRLAGRAAIGALDK